MLRRLSISFCFLLAFAMLQAHNLVPHHHHKEITKTNHHHDHENDNDDDADHDFPFTDLTHQADFGKVLVKPAFNDNIYPPLYNESIAFNIYESLLAYESPPRPHPPDNDSRLHIIFLSHSVLLRAPPASSYLS